MGLTPAVKTRVIGLDFAANGHMFDKDMVCKRCKRTWEEHQSNPHACIKALKVVSDRVYKLRRHVDREVVKIHDALQELRNVADYEPGNGDDTEEGQEAVCEGGAASPNELSCGGETQVS